MNIARRSRHVRRFVVARRAGVVALSLAVTALTSSGTAPHATATAASLLIDAGAATTRSTSVSVTLALGDEPAPTDVRLANDGTLSDGVLTGGQTFVYAAALTWSLDAAPCAACPGDGERTVWAQWRVGDGPWSSPVADAIHLDRTAPTGTVVIEGGAQYFGDPWAWEGSSYTFPDARLSLNVQDAGPDLPPSAWALSRDGVNWSQPQFPGSGYGAYEYFYDIVYMNPDEGTKKVWVKWRDAAGNWSAPATDTIILRYEEVGRVIVDDGGGYTDSFIVSVRVPVDVLPPEGVATVHVASDYWGCADPPYDPDCPSKAYTWTPGMVIQWDMRDTRYLGSTKEGGRRVVAWWRSKTGRVSELSQQAVVVDLQPAVTGPPRPTVTYNSIVNDTTSSSRVNADIRWTSSGTGSPISSNQLHQSTNSGSWTNVTLSTPLATSATRSLSPTATYRFRSRSLDKAGNWSTWTTGATFRVSPIQQNSTAVRYSGTWYNVSRTDASGGSLKYARAQGAKATMTFTGRGIAVIAPRSSKGGEMAVYIDGVLSNTVYLHASSYQARRVVYTKSWTSSGTHTITLVKKYANTDSPIFLDGFLVLR